MGESIGTILAVAGLAVLALVLIGLIIRLGMIILIGALSLLGWAAGWGPIGVALYLAAWVFLAPIMVISCFLVGLLAPPAE